MAMTKNLQKIATQLRKSFKNKEFKTGEAADTVGVSSKTMSKNLGLLESEGVVRRIKRGVWALVATKKATKTKAKKAPVKEETVSEDNVVETTTDAVSEEAKDESVCQTREYDVYLNGNYVTTLETTLEEITDKVRISYPGALLEKVTGTSAYFVEQAGTKG